MAIPETTVANQHIISIVFNGVRVGFIQRWAPRQTRRMTPVYEINSATSGKRVDIVPGNVETLQIDVERYDLFNRRMHEAFGFSASAIHLADHTRAFEVQEVWRLPSGAVRGTVYKGCWFSSIGRDYSAQGDRVIMARGQLEVTDMFDFA